MGVMQQPFDLEYSLKPRMMTMIDSEYEKCWHNVTFPLIQEEGFLKLVEAKKRFNITTHHINEHKVYSVDKLIHTINHRVKHEIGSLSKADHNNVEQDVCGAAKLTKFTGSKIKEICPRLTAEDLQLALQLVKNTASLEIAISKTSNAYITTTNILNAITYELGSFCHANYKTFYKALSDQFQNFVHFDDDRDYTYPNTNITELQISGLGSRQEISGRGLE